MKQGTIKDYDSATRSGTILDDARVEHAFGPESFSQSGLREFRLGQRVKFAVEGDKVRDLSIVTL